MATRTDNQLQARVPNTHAESLVTVADEKYDGARPEAERAVIEEGLTAMGYLDRPTEAHELFLWWVNRIGLTLGFVGLIMVGYGVFGPRINSVIGFGLLLTGFLFVALDEFITAVSRRRSADDPVDVEGAKA